MIYSAVHGKFRNHEQVPNSISYLSPSLRHAAGATPYAAGATCPGHLAAPPQKPPWPPLVCLNPAFPGAPSSRHTPLPTVRPPQHHGWSATARSMHASLPELPRSASLCY